MPTLGTITEDIYRVITEWVDYLCQIRAYKSEFIVSESESSETCKSNALTSSEVPTEPVSSEQPDANELKASVDDSEYDSENKAPVSSEMN